MKRREEEDDNYNGIFGTEGMRLMEQVKGEVIKERRDTESTS